MSYMSEERLQKTIISIFKDDLEYKYVDGRKVIRDEQNPLYIQDLKNAIKRLNSSLPAHAHEEIYNKVFNLSQGILVSTESSARIELYKANRVFWNWLQNGFDLSYMDEDTKSIKHTHVRLIDFVNSQNNTFVIAEEWTVQENTKDAKRADLVIFVNGLPVIVQELKSPERHETDIWEAYNQLQNYMYEIPSLFVYNAFLVISDFANTKVGTLTADTKRFMDWKLQDGSTGEDPMETTFAEMFPKEKLLDLLQNFILFTADNKKILTAYHQYYATHKTVDSIIRASAIGGNGKGGVVWHTQGSGKSLTMMFTARLLQNKMETPTILVITDRNDLDGQLWKEFLKAKEFFRQTPIQALSREDLSMKLKNTKVNGLIFTTLQKFQETSKAFASRRNIVVFVDEAHRSQYGLSEKIGIDGMTHKGAALRTREALPNATYVGFTGTPISKKDRSTTAVFGDLIDTYDMTRAVKDGATVPVYYESRILHIGFDQSVLDKIDKEYELIGDKADEYTIEDSKRKLTHLEALLGAPATIKSLCEDIISHYENHRADYLTGKAMIVGYSRSIAISIYKELLQQRPTWDNKLAVIMTGNNSDPIEWHSITQNKKYREETAKRFKDDNGALKIVIVVDMWLTGFDVPSLATMYAYKPMKEHNLMQAIARTNRVFDDKEGGLIIDYIGLKNALQNAMQDYSVADQNNYGNPNIENIASEFRTLLSVCRSLLQNFNYSGFATNNTRNQLKLIRQTANFLLEPSRTTDREKFVKVVREMHQKLLLCSSIISSKSERLEEAFLVAVRTTITRLTSIDKPKTLQEINEQIGTLIKESIQSDGVISLFGKEFDVDASMPLSELVGQLANMEEKNVAVQLIRGEIGKTIIDLKKTNLVKSEKFSKQLANILDKYLQNFFTSEEVIKKLLEFAREINEAELEAEELGLTEEELAFYDAITKPAGIKDFYKNDELIELTKVLTEILRTNKTIDWKKRHDARATMKTVVKRLLRKYKYPPRGEEFETAVITVVQQSELWADN